MAVCSGSRDCGEALVRIPSILKAGGKSAVMNKSLALWVDMSLSISENNWDACSRFMVRFLLRLAHRAYALRV